MMEKTVKKIAPLTNSDIRRIAITPEKNLYYVLPGLLKEEIRKETPTAPKEEKKVSPYVLPGLKAKALTG